MLFEKQLLHEAAKYLAEDANTEEQMVNSVREIVNYEYDVINTAEERSYKDVKYVFVECDMPEDGEYRDACRGSQSGKILGYLEREFKNCVALTDEDSYGHRIFVVFNEDELSAKCNGNVVLMDRWCNDVLDV